VFVNVETSVVNDFSGIEEIMRIKGRFDFGHDVQKVFAELFAHEFGASDAKSMLTGQRAFELKHKRGNFIGKLAEFLDVLFRTKIKHGPNVKKTCSGVAIIGGFETKRRHERLKARDVGGEVAGPDGDIFDSGNRFGTAFSAGDKWQACFSH